MAAAAGFTVTGYEDLSSRVARTWSICARRLARDVLLDPPTRRLALVARNRVFARTILRLMAAYRTGAMRYGIFTLAKPSQD